MTFASGLELAMGLWLGGKTKALYKNTSSIWIIRHVWTCLHTVLHCLLFFWIFLAFSHILVHWHAFKHWSHRWLICPRSIVVLVKLMLESSLFFEDCWPCPLNCFWEWFWVSLKICMPWMPWVTCSVGLMLFDACSIMFLSVFGWGVAHLPMDNVFLVQLCFRAASPQHFSSFTMRTGTCVWSRTFITHKKTIESVCCWMFFVSFILMIIYYTFPSAQDKMHEHGTAIDALDGFCVTLMIEWAWSTGSRWLHSLSTNISNSPCSETPRGS